MVIFLQFILVVIVQITHICHLEGSYCKQFFFQFMRKGLCFCRPFRQTWSTLFLLDPSMIWWSMCGTGEQEIRLLQIKSQARYCHQLNDHLGVSPWKVITVDVNSCVSRLNVSTGKKGLQWIMNEKSLCDSYIVCNLSCISHLPSSSHVWIYH